MNYVITKKCNKGCPYCFAHESRLEDASSFMSFEDFKSLVEGKGKTDRIKLIGGEPTQHPQFKEILKYLSEKKRPYVLISNFLFEDDILEAIVESIKAIQDVTFLINSTDLDKANRLDRWAKNYNTLYSMLYPNNLEEGLSVGITLYKENTSDYYIDYLNKLKNKVPKLERLRISINFPGNQQDKNPLEYIKDTSTGNIILNIVYWCISNFILPSIDCIIYPCMFSNKEELKLVKKFADKIRFECTASATDIFPDNTVSHCYPLKETVKVNLDNYNNVQEASNALKTSYNIVKSLVSTPEECTNNCTYFLEGLCSGPALCHYDLSKLDIPQFM